MVNAACEKEKHSSLNVLKVFLHHFLCTFTNIWSHLNLLQQKWHFSAPLGIKEGLQIQLKGYGRGSTEVDRGFEVDLRKY